MVNERLKVICLVIAVVALSAAFTSEAHAKTNFARKSQKAEVEVAEQVTPLAAPPMAKQSAESGAETGAPCCPNPDACESGEENPAETRSLAGKIGDSVARSVNRFLAFGCRLNHGFLSWVIDDKCEKCEGRYNCP